MINVCRLTVDVTDTFEGQSHAVQRRPPNPVRNLTKVSTILIIWYTWQYHAKQVWTEWKLQILIGAIAQINRLDTRHIYPGLCRMYLQKSERVSKWHADQNMLCRELQPLGLQDISIHHGILPLLVNQASAKYLQSEKRMILSCPIKGGRQRDPMSWRICQIILIIHHTCR